MTRGGELPAVKDEAIPKAASTPSLQESGLGKSDQGPCRGQMHAFPLSPISPVIPHRPFASSLVPFGEIPHPAHLGEIFA